jgi:insertion element IS1 protein InsB
MIFKILHCPSCKSKNIVRNGHAPNGKQKYLCKDCRRHTRENPTPPGYSEEEKDVILRAYQERSSLRGVHRIFGVARNTVSGWIRQKATALPELRDTLVAPDPEKPDDAVLELDELWSFVWAKAMQAWIWIALCRKTRQIVAYAIGDRSEKTCALLWSRIPDVYRHGTCYTDFWGSYHAVIPEEQHRPRKKGTGVTSHIERWNNTLRQRLGRFVRKSLSFSKSLLMHDLCLRLFLHRYNLDRALILA